MKPITVTTCTHRGKKCLRAKINGRSRYRVIQNPDRIEQERQSWLLELLGDSNPTLKAKRVSLDQHLADWRDDLIARGYTRHHVEQAFFRVRRLLATANITRLDQITESAISTTIANLRRRPKKKGKLEASERPFSQNTRNHYLSTAKAFINWCVRNRRMTDNPLQHLRRKLVTDRSEQRHPRDRFQPDELFKLIANADRSSLEVEAMTGPERAWLYRLASVTGFRRGELATLRPSSFAFGDEPIAKLAASNSKNRKPARQPLPNDLVPELAKWLVTIPGDRVLFPGLADKDAAKMVEWDCQAAAIPLRTTEGKRSFHSLRNTYISMLADVHPIALVQKLARHSDIRQTAAYYRAATDAERAAVNGLPSLGTEAVKPRLHRPGEVA